MSDEIKNKADEIIRETKERKARKKNYTLHTYNEGLVKTYDRIIWRMNLPAGQISGIPTGFKSIDAILDGWQPGESIVIAGRPGKGKTAFVQQSIRHAAKCGYPIGFFTIEMNDYQLFIREISVASQIGIQFLHTGAISDPQVQRILKSIDDEKLHALPIIISYDALEIHDIEQAAVEMVEEKKCKMIVVDYLQLVTNKNKTGSREQEVSSIIGTLKGFAKRYNVPVVIISSLNRAGDFAKNKAPELSNLRDSGTIEYAADVVIFIITDWKKRTAQIVFEKGRNYGNHTRDLKWDPYSTQFIEIEEKGDE